MCILFDTTKRREEKTDRKNRFRCLESLFLQFTPGLRSSPLLYALVCVTVFPRLLLISSSSLPISCTAPHSRISSVLAPGPPHLTFLSPPKPHYMPVKSSHAEQRSCTEPGFLIILSCIPAFVSSLILPSNYYFFDFWHFEG